MSVFPLISAQWLKGQLDNPDVVVLDATFHLPIFNRDAAAEFVAERIPGARFFDVDNVKDPKNPLPHMVPSPELFAATVGGMGISNNTQVVCYDTYGLFSAARPWWMFRLFGHENVCVLDGGLPAWKDSGLPLESGPPDAPDAVEFNAGFRPELIKYREDVLAILNYGGETVLDARPADRFDGSTPEPRPEVRSGHIPGSLNLSFLDLVDPGTKKVKSVHGLQKLYEKAGLRVGRDKVVTTCGSGVTACSLALGLHLLGDETVAVYDGSWSEWGTHPDSPIDNPSA